MKLILIIAFSILLSGCNISPLTPTLRNPIETITPLSVKEPTSIESNTTLIPTLPLTQEIPMEHPPVTLEDVKNVERSFEIATNEEGVLTGLPEVISEEEKLQIEAYYKAIQKKFLGSKVFYNKDEKTGNWLLFARLENNLFHRVISIEGRGKLFADYPLRFEPSVSDVDYKIVDFYKVIVLENDSVDVIWKEGIPQFVSDEFELAPSGDRYFTKYLIYDIDISSDESSLWVDVPGVIEIISLAPTPEISDAEKTLDPISTFSISEEYLGVKINANLIVDRTISDSISSVSFYDKSKYAEYVARTVFSAWWSRGNVSHSAAATENDFEEFMVLWARAQDTNQKLDWEKVQLNNVWANNLDDGAGYVQKKYTIWPMYFGEPIGGITGIRRLDNVFLSDETYNTVYWVADLYKGIGTNVSQDNLLIYHRFTKLYRVGTTERIKIMLSAEMSCAGWWLHSNKAEEKIINYPTPCNLYLENLLKSNLVVSR